MRFNLAILLGLVVFCFGAQADSISVETSPAPAEAAVQQDASTLFFQTPTFLDDADAVEACPDVDADGEGAPVPIICNCLCNGVAVAVNLACRHGETCNDVNGRPCNTGAGWSTYNGC
ncbi:MAG: hypothetical protein K0U98_14515 [Deltaproteobacteria bacterium]|nr:hypothetical protein [Deltaproteobacteria bacterium]